MADISMQSIGSGIADQGKVNRGFESIVARRQAADALGQRQRGNKSEKLINLDDFGGGMDKLLPAYATQIKTKLANAANLYGELEKQYGDPVKARNKWEQAILPLKSDIAALRQSNDSAIDYLQKKSQKTFLTPDRDEAATVFYNPNATAEDFTRLNNADNGITATPDFGFSANLTPRVDILGNIEKHNKNATPDVAKTTQTIVKGVGGKQVAVYSTPFIPNDNEVNNATNEILGDPAALINYKRSIRPQLSKDDLTEGFDSQDPTERARAQRIEVENFVRKNMSSKPDIKYETYTPPQPTAADKKNQWQVEGNTYKNGNNVWAYDKDPKGNETITFSKVNPSDNQPLTFEGGEKGVPVRFIIPKEGTDVPKLVIEEQKKVPLMTQDQDGNAVPQLDGAGNPKYTTQIKEKTISYSPYNADKIKNEYGQNPYTVREKITGSAQRKEGGTTQGQVKEEVKVSSKKSEGSSSSGSDDKIVVEKDGKKFRLPKTQLDAAIKQGYKQSR